MVTTESQISWHFFQILTFTYGSISVSKCPIFGHKFVNFDSQKHLFRCYVEADGYTLSQFTTFGYFQFKTSVRSGKGFSITRMSDSWHSVPRGGQMDKRLAGRNSDLLERALRALASSSGGAACPGGTRGQPRGPTPGVRGWFQGDLSEKNFCDTGTPGRMDGQTW